MKTFKTMASVAMLTTLVTGCVSSQLTQSTKKNVAKASESALADIEKFKVPFAKDKASIEANQEVDAPYIAGRAVPLARDVSLPRPLQKGMKTALIFPERRVSIATAAERIMIATGITVNIGPDVYMDSASLLPKKASAPTPAAAAPTILGATSGVTSLPSISGVPGSTMQPTKQAAVNNPELEQDSARSFEFPQVEAPLSQILDMISVRLGIHWKYIEATNSIRFYRLVTKSWQIPVSPAANSYSTVLEGGTAQSTNANVATSKSSTSPISSQSNGLNDLYSIRDSVDTLLTKSGSLSANLATGTITLTDTSEVVDAADTMIKGEIKILSRVVYLRLQTVQVTTKDNGESGVDLAAIVNKALKGIPDLTMSLNGPSSLVSSNAGSLAFNVMSGESKGTTAVIKSLQEIGDVQTSTEMPLSTRNRHAIYYNVRNAYSYVASTTPAAATSGGTGGTPGITTAQDTVGLKLMLYPNVTSGGTVMLTVALDQSVLQSKDTFSSGAGMNIQSVQLPNVNGEGSTQEVPIRNGQTVVLAGFDRVTNQYDKRTLGDGIPYLAGGSMTAGRTRTTTLVLASVVTNDLDN
jgi:type IVB pilus formation R64 PilN family outer membrane protein